MGIKYDEGKQTFTLDTFNTTYQMQVDRYGFLLHLYYGKTVKGSVDYLLTYLDRGFSGNPYDAGKDRTYSMDVLPQEFPCHGTGDYRGTAFAMQEESGAYACDFRYKRHEVRKGKYGLPGLPAVYAEEKEADTLEIILEDNVTRIQAHLLYGVLPGHDIITRSVRIENAGEQKVSLLKVQSACIDFTNGDFDLITFYGRHAMERNYQREPLAHGSFVIGSRRGTSSHQYSPMMILAERAASEDAGGCLGLSFVYSGGFKAEAELDQYGQTRLLMGLSDERFCYPLDPGGTFTAPEVMMTYSSEGLSRLSHNLHRCMRANLCRGKYKEAVRPVLLNSWEAAYFDFDGETIYRLARQAAEAGIDMIVMDDGWFGKRDDDYSGLGDWKVNEQKLGMTLGRLIERVNALGLKFGIWMEPEMVSEDSELYRQHPDWVLKIPGRDPVRARYQLVLDFSRKEVVDAMFRQICSVLDEGNIEYMKWDMNRSICDVYSASGENEGKVLYDYMLGLYDILERLCKKYPDMLMEGCSGGGGRFDAGMLYYTPQIWCSDNTDAIDRLRIQYGTSFGYPISAVGSHVSAVPNHQTGRTVPMRARAVTAMAGSFGYELDMNGLSEEEKEEIRVQIRTYKADAALIRQGLYYRLTNPFEDELCAWEFVSDDGEEALLFAVRQNNHGNMTVSYVRLRGLCPEGVYEDMETKKQYFGNALMEAGLVLAPKIEEYESYRVHLRRREGNGEDGRYFSEKDGEASR